MKIAIIICLSATVICLMVANHQLSVELSAYRQQATTYRLAYERVCKQTRVPVQSNFDRAMAGYEIDASGWVVIPPKINQ